MSSFRVVFAAALCAALLAGACGQAHAGKWNDELADRVFENYKRRADDDNGDREQRYSLDQAVNKVRRQYGGKVIKAETRERDGNPVHYIKLLSGDGKVRTVRVDGRTGRIQ